MHNLFKKISLFFIVSTLSFHCFAKQSAQQVTACPDSKLSPESSEYVYCGPAVCTPDTKGQTAHCENCRIMNGPNFGNLSCKERAPIKSLNLWYSSFGVRTELTKTPQDEFMVVCDPNNGANTSYADCLNAPCRRTGANTATCLCQVVNTQHTYAVQVSNCKSAGICHATNGEILNGAPTALVAPALLKLIKNNPNGKSVTDYTCNTPETRRVFDQHL